MLNNILDIPSPDWVRRVQAELHELKGLLVNLPEEKSSVNVPLRFGRTIKLQGETYPTTIGTNVYDIELLGMGVYKTSASVDNSDPGRLYAYNTPRVRGVQLTNTKWKTGFYPIRPRRTFKGVFFDGAALLPEWTIVEVRTGPEFAIINPRRRIADAVVKTVGLASTRVNNIITCKKFTAEILYTEVTNLNETNEVVKLKPSGEVVDVLHKFGSTISINSQITIELGMDGRWRQTVWEC